MHTQQPPIAQPHTRGPSDSDWFLDPAWDAVPGIVPDRLPLDGIDRVLVVAPHAAEAMAAVGATLAALRAGGVPVVLATQEAVPPQLLDMFAPGVQHTPAGAQDAGVRQLISPHLVTPGTLVLAPCTNDGDRARDELGRAAVSAADAAGAPCLAWPLTWWQSHDLTPQALDTIARSALLVEPGPDAVEGKHAALGDAGTALPADLADAVHRQLGRPFEVLFGTRRPVPASSSGRAEGFNAMYDAGDDPWGWERSWYERRRRRLLMATLQHERLHHVLELGCATGLLTTDLHARADHVTALDVSARALGVARRRDLENVTWMKGELPDALPTGRFDAVVVSEVAYFLTPSELLRLLRGIRARLDAGGEVVFVDWRHPSTGIPLNGELVHRLVGHVIGVQRAAHYEDADLLLDVFCAAPTPAEREGLT